jgi:choline-sulfatase
MIRQGSLEYQWYGDDVPEVLFDLEKDPREQRNVINEPAYTDAVGAFRTRLARLGHGPQADPNYVNPGY